MLPEHKAISSLCICCSPHANSTLRPWCCWWMRLLLWGTRYIWLWLFNSRSRISKGTVWAHAGCRQLVLWVLESSEEQPPAWAWQLWIFYAAAKLLLLSDSCPHTQLHLLTCSENAYSSLIFFILSPLNLKAYFWFLIPLFYYPFYLVLEINHCQFLSIYFRQYPMYFTHMCIHETHTLKTHTRMI